jgi:hypothetical protein
MSIEADDIFEMPKKTLQEAEITPPDVKEAILINIDDEPTDEKNKIDKDILALNPRISRLTGKPVRNYKKSEKSTSNNKKMMNAINLTKRQQLEQDYQAKKKALDLENLLLKEEKKLLELKHQYELLKKKTEPEKKDLIDLTDQPENKEKEPEKKKEPEPLKEKDMKPPELPPKKLPPRPPGILAQALYDKKYGKQII